MAFMNFRRSLVFPLLLFPLTTFAAEKYTEPSGYVLVEESYAIDMQKMPLLFMNDARTNVLNKNYGDAASDIKAAGRLVGLEANQVQSSDSRAELLTEARILTRLGQDLGSGKVISVEDFNARLADSAYHQAAHHRLRAVEAWSDHQYKRAGHEMSLAADAIGQGASWTGRGFEKATSASLSEIHDITEELKNGTGWTEAEVKKQMANLDTVVTRFGNDLGINRTSGTASAKKQPKENGTTSGTTQSKGSTK